MYTQKVFNITDLRKLIYNYKNNLETYEKEKELVNSIKSSIREVYDMCVDYEGHSKSKLIHTSDTLYFTLDKNDVKKIMFMYKEYYNNFNRENIRTYFDDIVDIYSICGNGSDQFYGIDIRITRVYAHKIDIDKNEITVYYECEYEIQFDSDYQSSDLSD